MSEFKPFRCPECGNLVQLRPRPDTTREYHRGVHLHLPDDLLIPSCSGCGDVFLNAARSAEIDARLGPVYAEWQRGHVRAAMPDEPDFTAMP